MGVRRSDRVQFVVALGAMSIVSLGFFGYGAWRNSSGQFSYLIWNLFLAWLPLVFAYWLTQTLRHKAWSSWEALGVSVLWLIFLPNSFYMISDFIHLLDVARVDVLYDAIMFTSFIVTGVALGYSSLYLVHCQLKKRLAPKTVAALLGGTLLLSSFAVYIGRDLRWNSWDLLTNPGGLLFDISDRLQHPATYPQMFVTIISFTILLSSMYWLLYRTTQLLHHTTA